MILGRPVASVRGVVTLPKSLRSIDNLPQVCDPALSPFMGGRKVGFMTKSTQAANRFPRGTARLFLAGLALCAAGVQAQDKFSLRLSPELTLPSAVAPSQAAVLQPVAAVPTAALTGQTSISPRDYRIGTDDLLDVQVF